MAGRSLVLSWFPQTLCRSQNATAAASHAAEFTNKVRRITQVTLDAVPVLGMQREPLPRHLASLLLIADETAPHAVRWHVQHPETNSQPRSRSERNDVVRRHHAFASAVGAEF